MGTTGAVSSHPRSQATHDATGNRAAWRGPSRPGRTPTPVPARSASMAFRTAPDPPRLMKASSCQGGSAQGRAPARQAKVGRSQRSPCRRNARSRLILNAERHRPSRDNPRAKPPIWRSFQPPGMAEHGVSYPGDRRGLPGQRAEPALGRAEGFVSAGNRLHYGRLGSSLSGPEWVVMDPLWGCKCRSRSAATWRRHASFDTEAEGLGGAAGRCQSMLTGSGPPSRSVR